MSLHVDFIDFHCGIYCGLAFKECSDFSEGSLSNEMRNPRNKVMGLTLHHFLHGKIYHGGLQSSCHSPGGCIGLLDFRAAVYLLWFKFFPGSKFFKPVLF